MIIANSDAPITVRIPLTTIDKPLVAPSIVPISIALAVPMACEALPIAIPFAMGSSIFSSDKNFSAKMFPNTPEMIMTTTVTDTKPPNSSETPIPMAVVIDLGRKVAYVAWSKLKSKASTKTVSKLDKTPAAIPEIMAL